MNKRFVAILLLAGAGLAGAPACRRNESPALEVSLVQKYEVSPGDVFYFRPRDGQFVLVERRRALAVALAPQPNYQVFAYENEIRVSWPAGEMLESRTFVKGLAPQSVVAISADGQTLAGGDAGGVLTLWKMIGGQIALQLPLGAPIRALAFSPDGQALALGLAAPAADAPHTVRIVDRGKNLLLPGKGFGASEVSALGWSSDGRQLAAGFADGSLELQDPLTSLPARKFSVSSAAVAALDFHPSGQFIASAHRDKLIHLVDEQGAVRLTIQPPLPPNPIFPGGIDQVRFNADGSRLAAAYAEGQTRIWNTLSLAQSLQKN